MDSKYDFNPSYLRRLYRVEPGPGWLVPSDRRSLVFRNYYGLTFICSCKAISFRSNYIFCAFAIQHKFLQKSAKRSTNCICISMLSQVKCNSSTLRFPAYGSPTSSGRSNSLKQSKTNRCFEDIIVVCIGFLIIRK